jgi:Nif-specific regulatory protein
MTEKDNFSALYEIAQSIHAILDPTQLLDTVLSIAMKHLDAERGFILLVNENAANGFDVVVSKNFNTEQESATVAASSSVVTEVLATHQAVLTFDALSDERFEASRSIIAQKILSILCIPLQVQDRVTGAVYVDSTRTRRTFNEESRKFLTVFGSLAAIAIENAQQFTALKTENERLRNEVPPSHLFKGILGQSKKWNAVLDLVHRVSDADVAVLITGETGTGKELIARAIHDNGARGTKPFVAINCSAIPEQLIESELFGHRRGSFTGAQSDKKGLLEMADGGTLLLDEIGELPILLQSKMLRVLQEKEFRRVGDVVNRKVNARILAATNRNLQDEIVLGKFRDDLFFRLNVVTIALPPLRERPEDIPMLAEHFLRKANEAHHREVKGIQPDAMKFLMVNPWKGNVRELQNVIERAVVLCTGAMIAVDDIKSMEQPELTGTSGLTLEEFERRLIQATLNENGGNRTRTAQKLGVSLRWLQYRLKEWSNE